MEITTEVLSYGEYVNFKFTVNEVGYVDIEVEEQYIETIYDKGEILDINQFEIIVRNILKELKLSFKNLLTKD